MRSIAIATSPFATSAHAAISFEFNFGDATLTTEQQQAVVTAGNLYSQLFAAYFTNTATVRFLVNTTNDSMSNAVESAGSYSNTADGFGNGELVWNQVVNGVDLADAGQPHGQMSINTAVNFQYDPNAPVDFAGGQIDFYSVIDHELTHAFGFSSSIRGSDQQRFYSKYDQFLTTKAGVPLIDPATLITNDAAFNEAKLNGALFSGPSAIAGYGSPVPIEGGFGAISHLATHEFSSPTSPQNALMLCCGGENVQFEPRDFNAAEIGILTDIGYRRVAAVPEPSTFAMLLVGLGFFGFAAKRRKS